MKNPEMLPPAQQTQANPAGVPAGAPSVLPPASPATNEARQPDALAQTTSQTIIDALEASNTALRVQNVQLMASNATLQAVNAELQDLGNAYQRQLHELTGLATRKR